MIEEYNSAPTRGHLTNKLGICFQCDPASRLLSLQTALDNFPEISVVTELKKDGETPAFKVRLSGKAYNKKTMKPYKMPNKVPQVRQLNGERRCSVNMCPAEGAVLFRLNSS